MSSKAQSPETERLRKVKQRKAPVPWVASGLVAGICSVTCQPGGQACPQAARPRQRQALLACWHRRGARLVYGGDFAGPAARPSPAPHRQAGDGDRPGNAGGRNGSSCSPQPCRALPGAQQDPRCFPSRMLSYFFPIRLRIISSYYSFICIDFSSLEPEAFSV